MASSVRRFSIYERISHSRDTVKPPRPCERRGLVAVLPAVAHGLPGPAWRLSMSGAAPLASIPINPMPPILELEGLTRAFGAVAAVDGVDLDIAEGEFFTIVGRSG